MNFGAVFTQFVVSIEALVGFSGEGFSAVVADVLFAAGQNCRKYQKTQQQRKGFSE